MKYSKETKKKELVAAELHKAIHSIQLALEMNTDDDIKLVLERAEGNVQDVLYCIEREIL